MLAAYTETVFAVENSQIRALTRLFSSFVGTYGMGKLQSELPEMTI